MKITCRICKIQHGEFFTLDSEISICGQMEHRLLDIYNKCLHLNALLHDSLPQVVCSTCSEKLQDFFEFQLKAESSVLELRKNLSDTAATELKSESLIKCIDVAMVSNSQKVEEGTSTEDEFEDIEENAGHDDRINDKEDDERNSDEEDEEIEDTDILFELYSKNDSYMEKYLKFENNESDEMCEEEDCSKTNNEIKTQLPRASIESDATSADQINPPLVSTAPTIEIARIKLPIKTDRVEKINLKPLDELTQWQRSECGRRYMTKETLDEDKKTEQQSEDCQCEICGYQLKSIYEYKEHMKTHGTERKFSCEFCDKSFATRSNLKAHIYIHTNLRPFKCEICGKAFQQKSILKTHMTLHTGKPFECTLCKRRFSRTAHLNIHMRHHNNIRPYQCSQCPNSYIQKSHLDRHISSSHMGVRFQCTVCGKMYTKKPSLNTHMREAHCTALSVLYKCEICDLDFAKQKGLYYHLKSKHPDYKKD